MQLPPTPGASCFLFCRYWHQQTSISQHDPGWSWAWSRCSCRRVSPNTWQLECQSTCRTQLPVECQKTYQTGCPREWRNRCQNEWMPNRMPEKRSNKCQVECPRKFQKECWKVRIYLKCLSPMIYQKHPKTSSCKFPLLDLGARAPNRIVFYYALCLPGKLVLWFYRVSSLCFWFYRGPLLGFLTTYHRDGGFDSIEDKFCLKRLIL